MADQPQADATHPGARSGHSMTPFPGGVALYGGLTFKPPSSETCSSDLYILATDTLRWKKVDYDGDDPQRCFAHCAVLVGTGERKLAVFAGMMNGGSLTDRLCVLDDVTKEHPVWKHVSSRSPAPCARWGHTGLRLPADGSMLVFGGMMQGNSALADLWQWHPQSQLWQRPACTGEAPGPRRRHTACWHEGSMYVFGGRDGEGRHFNDLYALDTERWLWRRVSYAPGPRPSARVGHAASVLNGVLVVSGGSSQHASVDSGYSVHEDAFALVLDEAAKGDGRLGASGDERRWERLHVDGDLPPRTMAASFASGNSIYVYGGRDTKCCHASLCSVPLPQALLKRSRAAAAAREKQRPKQQAPLPQPRPSPKVPVGALTKRPAPAGRPAALQPPAAAPGGDCSRGAPPPPPQWAAAAFAAQAAAAAAHPPGQPVLVARDTNRLPAAGAKAGDAAQQQQQPQHRVEESPFSKFARGRLSDGAGDSSSVRVLDFQ
eukprot:TRINITY_DN13735_c0_g1_i1.p1 TRINITY_DN13735_c0_g1~~TRINITY_DN13735_c0_g1_i1.p1  ORF type:complete len:517 (+),score=163.46 TRINITY_DN13735_c0_g1_i1:84-1553(+)